MERMEKERQALNGEGNLMVENCGQRQKVGPTLWLYETKVME